MSFITQTTIIPPASPGSDDDYSQESQESQDTVKRNSPQLKPQLSPPTKKRARSPDTTPDTPETFPIDWELCRMDMQCEKLNKEADAAFLTGGEEYKKAEKALKKARVAFNERKAEKL